MLGGWFKIYRKILEWEWFGDANTLHVFIFLLAMAETERTRKFGLEIQRGQAVTSRSQIGSYTHLSDREIRTAISHLKTTNEVTIESTNKFSIVTITKFEDYQYVQDADRPAERPSNRQATDQQSKDEKERNKEKVESLEEEKKEIYTNVYTKKEAIDRLYKLYPSSTVRREGNRSQLKTAKDKNRIENLLKTHTEEDLESTIKRYVKETDPKYLKMFSTFLNNLPDYSEPELPINDDKLSAANVLGDGYREWMKTKKGQEFNELFK